jgi:hypothetical protein
MPFATFVLREGNIVDVQLQTTAGDDLLAADLDEFLNGLASILSQQQTFALLINCTGISTAPMRFAMRVVEFMKKHRAEFQRLTRATAIVVESQMVRNVLSFIFAIQPPASPHKLVATHAEALAYLQLSEGSIV